jgi:acetylornithine deacetylase
MKTVVEHLAALVRIPSVSAASNRGVIEYAAEVLHQANWSTRRVRYEDAAAVEKINLMAAPPGEDIDDPLAELAFLCHTDTVPYALDWKSATEPSVAEGLLYGCGACDVKGFLACLLAAVDQLQSTPLMKGLRLALTADEEIGCVGAKSLLKSGRFRPRRLVIGEPTSLHPARAGKGYCLAEITVFGRQAHSAHPQRGRSAILDAARLIVALEALAVQKAERVNSFFEPACTTLNVGTISGGTAKNIVPGRCSFQLEWRPIPGEPPDSVPMEVAGIMQRMQAEDAEFRAELNVVRQQAGFETAADSALLRSMQTLLGRAAVSIPFGSEAPVFAAVAEEVLVFGPGDMRTAHSSRECVPLSELDEAVACIKALMIAG